MFNGLSSLERMFGGGEFNWINGVVNLRAREHGVIGGIDPLSPRSLDTAFGLLQGKACLLEAGVVVMAAAAATLRNLDPFTAAAPFCASYNVCTIARYCRVVWTTRTNYCNNVYLRGKKYISKAFSQRRRELLGV